MKETKAEWHIGFFLCWKGKRPLEWKDTNDFDATFSTNGWETCVFIAEDFMDNSHWRAQTCWKTRVFFNIEGSTLIWEELKCRRYSCFCFQDDQIQVILSQEQPCLVLGPVVELFSKKCSIKQNVLANKSYCCFERFLFCANDTSGMTNKSLEERFNRKIQLCSYIFVKLAY